MGRYTTSLAPAFADAAGIVEGMRVFDVGCGPGGLTREIARRVGAENVAAIDPARSSRAHAGSGTRRGRREGEAEALPWKDGSFDATLASLVVAFMRDPDAGVREMARVTRAAARSPRCVWDIAGGGMDDAEHVLGAARTLDPAWQASACGPASPGRSRRALPSRGPRGRGGGQRRSPRALLRLRGVLAAVEPRRRPGRPVPHITAPERQDRLREACRERLPDGVFSLTALAWYARGVATG
jgi:SAM-dependent methyltransferase